MQTSFSLSYTLVKFKLLSNSSTSADEVLTGLLEPIKALTTFTGVAEKWVPSEAGQGCQKQRALGATEVSPITTFPRRVMDWLGRSRRAPFL